MDLQIAIRERGDVSILDLLGKLTMNGGESETLSKRLRDLDVTGKRKLLLNLKNLSLIDSSGVGIVVQTYISLKRSGGELKLIAQGRVRDVLRVFRLQTIIPSFEDENDALSSFLQQGLG